MIIEVINRSTLVTEADAQKMIAAVDEQAATDFAQAWGTEPSIVTFTTDGPGTTVPPGAKYGVIWLVDTIADVPAGVLGFHTEAKGAHRSGFVAAKPELDAGGQVLTGDWSVASVLSHEVLEMLADPACSFWANEGPWSYALEVCDPVEAPTYEVDGVSVSNFCTPTWFDPDGLRPFDWLGLLHEPFTLLSGGYCVRSKAGAESEIYGAEFPQWRRDMKAAATSRTARRRAGFEPAL